MNYYFMIVLTLFCSSMSHAQIFRWTDANGTVNFSDIPHPGSQKVILPKTITTPPSQKKPESTFEKSSSKADESAITYDVLVISQPANNETIRNSQGLVPVIVDLKPDLAPEHLLQLIYDGKPLGKPQSGLSFALNDVNRGSHTIAVQVIDKEGKALATSDAITIYMHRPRVGMVRHPIGG